MKSIELFAGAGGLAIGLEMAGFENIGLVEIDKYSFQTLSKNRPNWKIFNKNILDLSNENLESLFNIKKGDLDLLSGGAPCQSFSYAGKKKGFLDDRGKLFEQFAIFLKKLYPKMFLFENVKGLLTHNFGKTFEIIKKRFELEGYHIQYSILNSLDYGVAQKRERLFLIGIRNDLLNKLSFNFPQKKLQKFFLKDILKNVPKSEGDKYSKKKEEIFKLVPPGGNWKSIDPEIAKEYMKKTWFMGGGRAGILRRMNWNEPSLTILTSPQMKQTERCHPDEIRPFTIRESARIQSFPDEWEFAGSISNQYKQIGNAVPVKLAYELGLEIKKTLEKI
ncbi:MAG: DNA cytosine methyltransferase [Metamycoplasmataceae bacterium]